ncbi:MAG: type II toxin-antitoxin system VapC family toxin [Treponema sp.]|nr:type II toxin-antitoxin system VapC family toxin [Treponema sp.]
MEDFGITDDEAPHYLLDSNIVSEIIKADANYDVIKKLSEHSSDCAICAPVWQELMFGMLRLQDGAKKSFLAKFIQDEVPGDFKILNYTKKSAEIHADLRVKLEKLGKPTQFSDSMIAAIALANRMILVTGNTRHFEAIQEVSDLQVENWFFGE